MSPDLQMSVLCDDVRQERSGKFILIGLFDVIGLPVYPAVFPRICIVNRWCCGQGKFNERTRIVGADGTTVVAESKDVPVNLPEAEATCTNVQMFISLRLETEGVYWVEILLDGDIKLRYPIRANRVAMPPQGGEHKAQG
jgi:hypothetical protein